MSSEDPKFTPPGSTGFKVKVRDPSPGVFLCQSAAGSTCTWSATGTELTFDAKWNHTGGTKHMAKSATSDEVTVTADSAGGWGSLELQSNGGYKLPHPIVGGPTKYLGNVASMVNGKIVLANSADAAIFDLVDVREP